MGWLVMLRGFFSDKRATSAVEFALIAPFLLLLVAAILAYGSIFATSISLQQVAAETARATIGGLSDAERRSLALIKLAAIGILLGLAASLALARVLRTLLYGIGEFDPVTFASVALMAALTAAIACYLPARRAAEADPMTALRE